MEHTKVADAEVSTVHVDGTLSDGIIDVNAVSKKTKALRVEKHKVHVITHDLVVSGIKVSKKKKKITVTQEELDGNPLADGKPIKTITEHSKTIEDRTYTIRKVRNIDGKITDYQVNLNFETPNSSMSDFCGPVNLDNYAIIEEVIGGEIHFHILSGENTARVKKFEEDWNAYWIPTITNEQIESGEFQKVIQETRENELSEKITFKETEGQESDIEDVNGAFEVTVTNSQMCPSMEVAALPTSSVHEITTKSEENFVFFEDVGITEKQNSVNAEQEVIGDSPIETFVKDHPLEVFYFGITMLLMAIIVFQCCFLPEYPACNWFNCILECMKNAYSDSE